MKRAPRTRQSRNPALALLPAATRGAQVQAVLRELEAKLQIPVPGADDIHRLRVNIKKLRGWIRLLRWIDRRGTGRTADAGLRAIAAGFAPLRDRHVLEQTLALLQEGCTDPAARAQLATLLPLLLTQPSSQRPTARSDAAWRSLHKLCARKTEDHTLRQGLQRSYRRARRLGKRACGAAATAELRHRWRKRVKYLAYQLQFVCMPDAGKRLTLQTALGKLGSTLGTLQDLQVLEQQLARLVPAAVNPATLDLARRLLTRERKRQRAAAARLYRSCFAGKRLQFDPGSVAFGNRAPRIGDPLTP